MKSKLIAFAVALVAIATVGVVQLTTQAQAPGTVGNAPRCTVTVDGPRGQAFNVAGGNATVRFTAAGAKNCKVQVSALSFYAPSANGRPFNQQIPFDSNPKVVSHGPHTLSVRVPLRSTPTKGCFYQLDLTYGTKIVSPVLAFKLGEIKNCERKNPQAKCVSLDAQRIGTSNRYRLSATADATDGATIRGYLFTITRGGNTVFSEPRRTNSEQASVVYTTSQPGTYNARVVVQTSEGRRNGSQCTDTFTVKKQPPKPMAKCVDLVVSKLEDGQYRFNGSANATGGATINRYEFAVYRDDELLETLTERTSDENASVEYAQTSPGDYRVQLTVRTSEGPKNGPDCKDTFMIKKPDEKHPDVEVTKRVEGKKYKRVGINVEFEYQIEVKNTGDVPLRNVEVTDEADDGVTLLRGNVGSVNGNVWTHTITRLRVNETQRFTLTAKVLREVAGRIVNTVCVDAPQIPGDKDDCDDAEVDVKKVPVCDPSSGKIIWVDEDKADQYEPEDSKECQEEPKTPAPNPKAPPVEDELPQTGPAETIVQLAGLTSLAGATAYYLASRRLHQ